MAVKALWNVEWEKVTRRGGHGVLAGPGNLTAWAVSEQQARFVVARKLEQKLGSGIFVHFLGATPIPAAAWQAKVHAH